MFSMGWRAVFHIAFIYTGATALGFAMSLLRIPLPWMIGPMIFAGMASILGRMARIPRFTRPIGQTVVAATVGLSFTPAAVSAVSQQLVPMLTAAVLTILFGFVAAIVLMRLTRIDVVSASLSSIPGGPVEMADLAARHGVDPSPVALAQTLRIAFLVLTVPPIITAVDGGFGARTQIFASQSVDPFGAALLLAVAVAGGLSFRWLRLPSPFFLGSLGFSAAAAALLLPVSAVPYPVLAAAQILLGVWLGTMFDREMLRRARRFLIGAVISTVLLLAFCAAMAFGISAVTNISWQTMVLATAPGSVTEMALTAKILQEGVALVTAFHIVRVFVILPSAPLIFAVMARIAGRAHDGERSNPKPSE